MTATEKPMSEARRKELLGMSKVPPLVKVNLELTEEQVRKLGTIAGVPIQVDPRETVNSIIRLLDVHG